jgi:hypothetical protein
MILSRPLGIRKRDMKQLANKAQKTFEAAIRMVMIKEGKNLQEAQNIVIEVAKEFQTDNVTEDTLKGLIACLEVTFLDKKIENVISDLLK